MSTELRAVRYEAERRDLMDRLIRVVEDRHGHTLAIAVEQAKIALTAQASVGVDVPYPEWEKITATREDFDRAVGNDVQRVVATVSGMLKDASLKADDINTIFVTGGSSMVPILRQSILSLFPRENRNRQPARQCRDWPGAGCAAQIQLTHCVARFVAEESGPRSKFLVSCILVGAI